jgi:hypothetical protein
MELLKLLMETSCVKILHSSLQARLGWEIERYKREKGKGNEKAAEGGKEPSVLFYHKIGCGRRYEQLDTPHG